MLGSPLKRARKQGVRLADGSIIPFPYMPRVAELPSGWQNFGPAQRALAEYVARPRRRDSVLGTVTDLDAHRLHVWLQVWRVVFMIGIKALFDGKLGRDAARERDRERVLGELVRSFEEAARQ